MGGAASATCVQPRASAPPESQNTSWRSWYSSDKRRASEVHEVNRLPRITPVRSVAVILGLPPRRDSATKRRATAKHPRKVATGKAHTGAHGRWKSTRTAANDPPLAIPRREGSAMGLRKSAWKAVPDAERAAPTRATTKMRGALTCQ